MDYQFVVIYISEERKKIIEKQFDNLDKKYKVIFMNACTPVNSESYLIGLEDKDKGKACCFKSHLKALQIAVEESSSSFTIILEDDIAFHKTQFINTIEEIINNWDEKVYPDRMMSIGWVPVSNYSEYIEKESTGTTKSILGSKIFNSFLAVGAQAYIIRKKDIKHIWNYVDNMITPTYIELNTFLQETLKDTNNPLRNHKFIPVDYAINWILGQKILFPPLVIEQDISSSLGHFNNIYWNKFFKDYEMIKDNYNL
jgi:GR25 family glycosyltransferase involved in LPS biosynthesis